MKILKFPVQRHPHNLEDQRVDIKLQEARVAQDRYVIEQQRELLKKQRERIFTT